MGFDPNMDLGDYCLEVARAAREASADLVQVSGGQKNAWLRDSAALLRQESDKILAGNEQDIAAAPGYGLTDAPSTVCG